MNQSEHRERATQLQQQFEYMIQGMKSRKLDIPSELSDCSQALKSYNTSWASSTDNQKTIGLVLQDFTNERSAQAGAQGGGQTSGERSGGQSRST